MKFKVFNRFSGKVQFTAEIDCQDSADKSLKLGLAVKWAISSGTNLEGANLEGANLEGANLNWTNLNRANLNRANLEGANLEGANLNWTNLEGANLNRANLNRANLNRANLEGASGVNDFVKCIQIEHYPIAYTATAIQIGCQRHAIEEWAGFSDAQIMAMDGELALKWWGKYKAWIFQTIARYPAKPTHGAA